MGAPPRFRLQAAPYETLVDAYVNGSHSEVETRRYRVTIVNIDSSAHVLGRMSLGLAERLIVRIQ